MPNARRIIFSTYVIPTQSIGAEEISIRHREFQAGSEGTLGGKGSAVINATQWGDGWTSFAHPRSTWADHNNVWEQVGDTWSGELSIMGAGNLTEDTSDLAFLYIKNTGTSFNTEVSLNGLFGNYYIIIPPGGSVHLRGDGTTLECNEVFARGAGGNRTTIEFIIAKE